MTEAATEGLRVLLVGDHPWAGFVGDTVSRCDPGPDGSCLGFMVKLDNGPMVHAYKGQWMVVGSRGETVTPEKETP